MPESDTDLSVHDIPATRCQTRLGFLLLDGFAMLSYAAMVEPFRAANLLSGRELYRWVHLSGGGIAAEASSGARVIVDSPLLDEAGLADSLCDILFVFAAGNPAAFRDDALFAALRRQAAHGARIAGVSGGPYILARAGLLDGHRATIHWEHQPAFIEAFPRVALEPALFVIDGNRITCAGGTAGLDLAVELIRRDHGERLAALVGEWHIRTQAREGPGPQRMALRDRYGVSDARLLRALALMEANLAEPLSLADIADTLALSRRQLERLFHDRLGTSAGRQYLTLRLTRAMALLRETELAVTEVAMACGFASPTHFARAFARQHGLPPSKARRR